MAVGNKALYKIEINQIMLKSPVCGCVTNLGCPYNLSQIMTEEGNKAAYPPIIVTVKPPEAVRHQAAHNHTTQGEEMTIEHTSPAVEIRKRKIVYSVLQVA